LNKKYKKLFSNTTIFFVSEFASKILVFLLLPLYTNILTTSEYGISDLITTTVTLLIPIFTLSMNQAVLRFAMEYKDSQQSVISYASRIVFLGTITLMLFYPLLVNVFNIERVYIVLFYVLFLTSSYDGILSYFARGIDKTFQVGISGFLKTAVTVGLNIVMLIVLKLSVVGYILSTVFAHLASVIYLGISCGMGSYLVSGKKEPKLAMEMLKYSIPLIPNSLSWWLSNYANRYIILFYLGTSVQGMYSAASKIPALLTTVQSIFINAWQLSAIGEYNTPDRDEFFSKIYRLYDFVMVVGASVIIGFAKPIAMILFSVQYFDAWKAVPFLLISVVFGAMSGHVGTIFAASMRTQAMFVSTLIGGVTAVIGCFLLVPAMDMAGAALSTAIANVVIWLIRLIRSRNYAHIQISWVKTISIYLLLFVQAFSYIYFEGMVGYLVSAFVLIIILFVNHNLISEIYSRSILFFVKI
jgi:O-antigen/teichoic acid export membrane protein